MARLNGPTSVLANLTSLERAIRHFSCNCYGNKRNGYVKLWQGDAGVELTIQELSARVDMTPRNIREWQTIGVLSPPRRRGRLAFYDESHVWRIERVKSLRGDGFPLDVIRQFLDVSRPRRPMC